MRKAGFIIASISVFCGFVMLTRLVFADECPPAGGSTGNGASSLFGGGMYSLMDASQYGGFVYALFVLLLLLFVLLVFYLVRNNQNKLNKTASSYDQPPISTTGGEAKVQQSNGLTQNVSLRPGSNPIGRNPGSAIQLNDPKVSGNHADLYVSEGRYTITDLNSSNGTFVNGEKITQRDLYQGDQIQIGDSKIIV